MNTKIELLSLDKNHTQEEAYRIYENIFSSISGEEEKFQSFVNTKSFFIALSDKINSCDIMVIAVESQEFLSVKQVYFKALKTHTDINSEVLKKVMDSCSSNLLDHSTIPKNASALLTKSGRNSGFVQKLSKRTIVFVPLENEDSKYIGEAIKALYPDISFEKAKNTALLEKYPKTSRGESLKETNEAKEDKKQDNLIPGEKSCTDAKESSKTKSKKEQKEAQEVLIDPQTALKKMKKKKLTAAVALSKYSDFIFSVMSQESDILFPHFDVSAIDTSPTKKEIASSALRVKNESGASLGISISDICKSGANNDKLYIYICIVDSSHAHILKFKSKKGESAKDFLLYAVYCLFHVLAKYSDTGIFKIPEKRLPLALPAKKREKKSSIKAFLYLLPIIIAAVVLLIFGAANIYQSTLAGQKASETTSQYIPANGSGISEIITDDSYPEESLSQVDGTSETETQVSDTESSSSKEESEVNETETSTVSLPAPPLTIAPIINTTTAARPTTTEKATFPNTTTIEIPDGRKGTFTFTAYGYGHGVGMSQNGAQKMARQGYNYRSILKHYYYSNGISIQRDTKIPKYVTHDGQKYNIKDYLGKVTFAEINTSFHPDAIKAQIIAIYTYSKHNGFNTKTGGVAFNKTFDYRGTPIEAAINEVLGLYLKYKDSSAFCPYFATSAGVTTSCRNVWGNENYPYLMGGRISPENPNRNICTIKSDDLKRKIIAYNAKVSKDKRIVLPPDPSKWIRIVEHDKALGNNLGYVSKIKVGNQVMSGNNFRLYIIGSYTLPSHCFTFTFTPFS